jgi:ABC-type glycerol-3-phosphate transport system substrate-binding protein
VSIALVIVAAFVLAACGGATAQVAKKPVNVQITLTEFKIESLVTHFTVGPEGCDHPSFSEG